MKNREFKDKAVTCRELNSGNQFSAKFEHDGSELSAEIYTWEEFHHFEGGEIFLEDTNFRFISLHDCISSPSMSFAGSAKYHKYTVDADFAVVGRSTWKSEERFKRVNFKINDALKLFTRGHAEAEFLNKYRSGDHDLTLLTLKLEMCTVQFSFECSAEFGLDRDPTITGVICDIEFTEPLELAEFWNSTWCITSFLSLCLGKTILPTDIHISRTDFKSWYKDITEKSHEDPIKSMHQVLWRESNKEKKQPTVGVALYTTDNEKERETFISALEKWILLLVDDDWGQASHHMCQTLSLNRNRLDAERVLCAFRWLESIPTFNTLEIYPDDTIKELTDSVLKRAEELNIKQASNRITPMIRNLKKENFKQQVDRIVSTLSEDFPVVDAMKLINTHINYARVLRGKAAHNIPDWSGTEKIDPYSSLLALEALCIFLMLKELPRSQTGQARIQRYVLVEDALRHLR